MAGSKSGHRTGQGKGFDTVHGGGNQKMLAQQKGQRLNGNWDHMKSQRQFAARGKRSSETWNGTIKETARFLARPRDRDALQFEDHAVFALAWVKKDGRFLQDFDESVRSIFEVAVAAAERDPSALQYAGRGIRHQKELMLKLVQKYGGALAWASRKLKDDMDIVMAAVTQNGHALREASMELKKNKAIVLAAVKSKGAALEHAWEGLKADKEVVLQAVKRNGSALQFASEEQRADQDVALAAIKCNQEAICAAGPKLKADKDFLLRAERCFSKQRDSDDRDNEAKLPMDVPRHRQPVRMLFLLPRHLWHDGPGRCYDQADATLQLNLPKYEFLQACASKLAVPGELAPVLTVTLSRADITSGTCRFLGEARLLSGTSFSFDVPEMPDRPEPLLVDLAAILYSELPQHCEIASAEHIFINFATSNGDFVPVTVWDWDQPLSEFL